MAKNKELLFDFQPCFGDRNSFYNYIKEQQKKVNPIIRTILLLKLGDLEIVYPKSKPLLHKAKVSVAHHVGRPMKGGD